MNITKENIAYEFLYILKENAPVRTHPLGATKYSLYPGNLKTNGIYYVISNNRIIIYIGGEPAIYAPWTEKTSHKPGWQNKSVNIGIQRLTTVYGGKIV